MHATQTTPTPQTGIVVTTGITAAGPEFNHAEGIAVATAVAADGIRLNHAEGIVSAPIQE